MKRALTILFGDGFRVFFLAAGLFGVFSMLIWEWWLGVQAAGSMVSDLPFAPPPYLWHGHEMVFGYATAALGGFLLTAVPGWVRSAPHLFVSFAFALWFAGRVAVWFSADLSLVLVAVADLSFLLLLFAGIAAREIKRPKGQNRVFLACIAAIWLGNLLVHLEWMELTGSTAATGLRLGMLAFCALIAVLAGRVAPGFTRNAMKRADVAVARWPRSPNRTERPALALIGVLPVAVLIHLPDEILGLLALAAGGLQLVRLAQWHPLWTWRMPILWALHLGVGMLGLGLILWGLALLGLGDEVAALHVLGIGAIGGMTLAVMSRAILGHTGRPQVASIPVALAYGLIAGAAGLRWIGSVASGAWYFPMTLASGTMWIAAFGLFLGALGPLVFAQREARSTKAAPEA